MVIRICLHSKNEKGVIILNALERVKKTLQFQEPDRVPVYPIISGVSRQLIGVDYEKWSTDANTTARALLKATDELGLDLVCTLTDLSVEAADFGAKLIYPENEAAHPDYNEILIKDIEGYKKVKAIELDNCSRMNEHIKLCRLLVDTRGDELPVVAFIFGPLGILSMLRGQDNLFIDMMTNPAEVKNALHQINQTMLQYCDALVETGVHAVMIDTLFASQSIMSKEMWLEFEGGYVKELAERVHKQGTMFMVHNCGSGSYFDAQMEMMEPEAISFLHLPADISSPEELKLKYGSKTTLIGHIDPTWIIFASEEEVREECRKQIEKYKDGGGFILATGCEYPANADLKNAEVMVEAAREYGSYSRETIGYKTY